MAGERRVSRYQRDYLEQAPRSVLRLRWRVPQGGRGRRMTLEMVGRIDECFLLSYAIDPARAASLTPAGLEPITHRGSAFLNIVVCHVDRIRPRFTPRAFGLTYWHVAYRIQVRAALAAGASIEGLY